MYEQTIEWLRKAGLILLAYNVESPKIPLSAYADFTKFKVFMHDVGLLAAKLKITSDQIVIPDAMFREFNGAFIENFIAQELISEGNNQLFYWTSRSYAVKYRPERIIRTSPRNLIESREFINIPLYAIGLLKRLI